MITIDLLIEGLSLPVAQLGPDFIFLKEPLECPPVEGVLVMTVDGNEQRWPVALPEGAVKGKECVRIHALKQA